MLMLDYSRLLPPWTFFLKEYLSTDDDDDDDDDDCVNDDDNDDDDDDDLSEWTRLGRLPGARPVTFKE